MAQKAQTKIEAIANEVSKLKLLDLKAMYRICKYVCTLHTQMHTYQWSNISQFYLNIIITK